MIKSANAHRVSHIFSESIPVVYEVPKYQREYVWAKDQWEALFTDLYDNEPGHFLGSIICITDPTDPLDTNRAELVDGQQRLTSIALLYCALYERLRSVETNDEEFITQRTLLKKRLIVGGQPRLTLSSENMNDLDFKAILDEVGLWKTQYRPPNVGNRRLHRAFNFLRNRVGELSMDALFSLIDKINQSLVVKIEVANHADAFALFESLNNRGLPLSAIDIIKNKILSSIDKSGKTNIDDAYIEWTRMIERLPDYSIQERFLRHYYNVFQFLPDVKVQGVRIARRSNLIKVYEKLIERNPEKIFHEITAKSETYARYVDEDQQEEAALLDLQRVGAAPAYALLLYLDEFHAERPDLRREVADFLVKYFVRRNLTDYPPTRELDPIFIDLIEGCYELGDELTASWIIDYLRDEKRYAPDDVFRKKLEGDIYLENAPLARFLLCKVEEQHLTRDFKPALWEKDRFGHYRMTLEHILPEGKNLPQEWVDMIADGDRELAQTLQHRWVHKIGNLTLTAYNPYLSNYPFEKKRDRVDSKGNYVGYRNGLYINSGLEKKQRWTMEDIEARTKWLVSEVMQIFG